MTIELVPDIDETRRRSISCIIRALACPTDSIGQGMMPGELKERCLLLHAGSVWQVSWKKGEPCGGSSGGLPTVGLQGCVII